MTRACSSRPVPEVCAVGVSRTTQRRLKVCYSSCRRDACNSSQQTLHHMFNVILSLAGWAGWSAGQVGRHVKCCREWNGEKDPGYRREGSTWDKLFAGVPELLVTPLVKGPVCLISEDRFEEPVRP